MTANPPRLHAGMTIVRADGEWRIVRVKPLVLRRLRDGKIEAEVE